MLVMTNNINILISPEHNSGSETYEFLVLYGISSVVVPQMIH